MRRIFLLTIFILLALTGSAQSDALELSRIMDGRVVPLERMVTTRVKGRPLKRYKLDYYRSARFTATAAEENACRKAVNNDRQQYGGTQWEQRTTGKGKVSLAFMLPRENGRNRFVSYVTQKDGQGRYNVILIYMEGSVASLKELKTLINQ